MAKIYDVGLLGTLVFSLGISALGQAIFPSISYSKPINPPAQQTEQYIPPQTKPYEEEVTVYAHKVRREFRVVRDDGTFVNFDPSKIHVYDTTSMNPQEITDVVVRKEIDSRIAAVVTLDLSDTMSSYFTTTKHRRGILKQFVSELLYTLRPDDYARIIFFASGSYTSPFTTVDDLVSTMIKDAVYEIRELSSGEKKIVIRSRDLEQRLFDYRFNRDSAFRTKVIEIEQMQGTSIRDLLEELKRKNDEESIHTFVGIYNHLIEYLLCHREDQGAQQIIDEAIDTYFLTSRTNIGRLSDPTSALQFAQEALIRAHGMSRGHFMVSDFIRVGGLDDGNRTTLSELFRQNLIQQVTIAVGSIDEKEVKVTKSEIRYSGMNDANIGQIVDESVKLLRTVGVIEFTTSKQRHLKGGLQMTYDPNDGRIYSVIFPKSNEGDN